MEDLSKKYDQSLFAFCSHNKKRPDNVILGKMKLNYRKLLLFNYYLLLGRLFDYHLLDMIEFGVENLKSLQDFKNSKVMTGVKPCLIFSGDLWHQNEEYTKCKSLLIDFFRGEQVEQVRLGGFEHALSFTAAEGKIYFRSYKQVVFYYCHLYRKL